MYCKYFARLKFRKLKNFGRFYFRTPFLSEIKDVRNFLQVMFLNERKIWPRETWTVHPVRTFEGRCIWVYWKESRHKTANITQSPINVSISSSTTILRFLSFIIFWKWSTRFLVLTGIDSYVNWVEYVCQKLIASPFVGRFVGKCEKTVGNNKK